MIGQAIAFFVSMYIAKSVVSVALSREIEKASEQKRLLQNTDPETGFHLKTGVCSMEEDAKRVNPGYNQWRRATTNNCVCCSFAYEMRRRGFDVIANKSTKGYDGFFEESIFPGTEFNFPDETGYEDTAKAIFQNGLAARALKMLRREPAGTRGIIRCFPLGNCVCGHSMAYYIDRGGSLCLIDAQNGQIYIGEQVDRFFKRLWYASYARLDHLPLDKNRIKEVCH